LGKCYNLEKYGGLEKRKRKERNIIHSHMCGYESPLGDLISSKRRQKKSKEKNKIK
jgi:hypothetical protein